MYVPKVGKNARVLGLLLFLAARALAVGVENSYILAPCSSSILACSVLEWLAASFLHSSSMLQFRAVRCQSGGVFNRAVM